MVKGSYSKAWPKLNIPKADIDKLRSCTSRQLIYMHSSVPINQYSFTSEHVAR